MSEHNTIRFKSLNYTDTNNYSLRIQYGNNPAVEFGPSDLFDYGEHQITYPYEDEMQGEISVRIQHLYNGMGESGFDFKAVPLTANPGEEAQFTLIFAPDMFFPGILYDAVIKPGDWVNPNEVVLDEGIVAG